MRWSESLCVGCETCYAGCSRKRSVLVCACDDCGEEKDPEELYAVGGGDYCRKCLVKGNKSAILDYLWEMVTEWNDLDKYVDDALEEKYNGLETVQRELEMQYDEDD